MEKIFLLIIGGLGIGLIIYIYYFFGSIALAIWAPRYAKQKWIYFSNSLKSEFAYFFFKWAATSWVLLVTISLAIKALLLMVIPENV